MKKLLTLCLLAFIGTTQVNAQCSTGNSSYNDQTTFANPTYVGQSFTASCSGDLKYIEFKILDPNQSYNIIFYLLLGAGDNGIGQATYLYAFQGDITSDANGICRVAIPTGLALTQGDTYTFLVASVGNNITMLRSNANPYPNGIMYYIFNSSFGSAPGYDMVFTVQQAVTCTPTTSTTNAAICAGGNYPWNGTSYNAAGSYDKHFTNAAGCDSTATLNLSLLSTPRLLGKALNFDGVDDEVSINPSSSFETSNSTVDLWVRPSGYTPYNPCLVCVRNNAVTYYSYHLSNDLTKVYFWNGGGLGIWNYNFNIGEWYHIAFVQNGSNTQVYVNGVSLGYQSITSSGNTGLPFHIGNNGSVNGEQFYGSMDELRLWSSALTQSQIQTNMTKELIGNETSLVAYYNFNASQGSVLVDQTGTGHDGTLNNFALSGTTSNWLNESKVNIVGPSAVCNGSTITLVNTAGLVGGVWSSLHSSVSINATTGVLLGKANSAQTATIQYKYAQVGCNVTATKVITSNTKPAVPSISYAAGTANPQYGVGGTFCAGKIFTLKGLPTGGVWSSTGGMTVDATSGLVTLGASAAPIAVTYTVTTNLGCSNSKTMSGAVAVCSHRGVDNGQWSMDNSQWTMYPNPARSSINLNVKALVGAGSIVVTDLFGKQVRMQTLSMGSNTVDISSLSKGFYLVSIITSEGKTTKKLIVE